MTVTLGTHSLETLRENRFQSVADFGEDTLLRVIQRDFAAHTAILQEMDRELVTTTTDRQRIYGASVDGGDWMETDGEFGRVPTQLDQGGTTVGFPLRNFQRGRGWTERTLAKMSVGEVAERMLNVQLKNVQLHRTEMRKALYLSANYTFRDALDVPVLDLTVRRLLNADSMAIPSAPDGSTFNAASHTHYTASATWTATAFDALITNVVEHGNGGRLVVAIHYADVANVTGLTGFIPASEVTTIPSANAATTVAQTNSTNQYNRYLGRFKGADVWVKPWALQNYALAYDAAAFEKPLVRRVDRLARFVGLRLAAETEVFPLTVAHYEDSFGYGVWGRSSAAVLYIGNSSYVDPSL